MSNGRGGEGKRSLELSHAVCGRSVQGFADLHENFSFLCQWGTLMHRDGHSLGALHVAISLGGDEPGAMPRLMGNSQVSQGS